MRVVFTFSDGMTIWKLAELALVLITVRVASWGAVADSPEEAACRLVAISGKVALAG